MPELGARRALLVLVAFLAAQLVTGLLIGLPIGVYIAMRGRDLGPEATVVLRNVSFVASALFGQLVGGLVALRMATRGLPRDAARARIGWVRPRRAHLVAAAAIGLALAAFYLLVLLPLFPPPPNQRWGPVVTAATAPGWPRAVGAVLAILVAPPVEELVFRGVLYGGFAPRLGRLTAGAVVTALFAAFHAFETLSYWPALLAVALLGAAAVGVRIVSGSLAPAIALHAAYNLGINLAMALASRRAG